MTFFFPPDFTLQKNELLLRLSLFLNPLLKLSAETKSDTSLKNKTKQNKKKTMEKTGK